MKTLLLTSTLFLLTIGGALASASVALVVQKEGGELQLINDRTKAGFIERGGKNYGSVKYMADPGSYTMTGTQPGCSVVTQPAAFEEAKSYTITLTEDCRIENVSF